MNHDNNLSVQNRVINAFFDTQAAAVKAVDDLVAIGIPTQHITQTGQPGGTTATDDGYGDKGFWESLKELFLPDEDRHVYAEGLRRGGYLVSVKTDEADYNRVLDILDNDGSVDLDEREGQWRSEGWSGYDRGTVDDLVTPATASASAMPAMSTTPVASASSYDEGKTGLTGASPATITGNGETVSLYEENLKVGKRDVSHGRVRLRTYVVESPVTEQVNLREERVFVDRKAVDRPVTAADTLFQDKTIEVEERAEEAVISKEARVKEEISLRKTSENRTQTVSDTVRHTEVDVQDARDGLAGTASKFSAMTDASQVVEHMDVISSDGQKVGTVDHLDGPDKIKLAKNTSPDGQHHFVPLAWIDHVDQHVHLRKSMAEVKAAY